MFEKKKWRWTTVFTIALIILLVGLALPIILWPINPNFIWVCFPLICLALLVKRRDIRAAYTIVIVLSLLFGWSWGSRFFLKYQTYNQFFGEHVVLRVSAIEDAVYNERGQLTFSANNIRVTSPHMTSLVGQIEISGFGANAVYNGDIVEASGMLYKKRGANQAGISYANIKVVSKGNSPIDKLRRNFAAGMQNALPEPLASFALGLLIGQRTTLGDDLTQKLTQTGLIHIVAVSGYNLTVIIHASQKLLSKRSRYQSYVLSIALIALFLLLTGNSPSIVRAAIVSIIALSMWYFGRKVRPLLLLSLAAAITASFNPLYLWSNIGWYLSFAAFFGVLVLAPLLQKRFLRPSLRESLLPTIFIETTAAQICTLPIILYFFGRLSVIGIVANLLVVPMVPLAMLFSLFAGIAGMIHFVLTGIIAFPARIILEYMLSVTTILSRVPHANVPFSITATQAIYLYGLLLFIIIVLQKSVKHRATIPQETKE